MHSDSVRLSFRAFAQEFHLHLNPTENLVPPDGATVRYTSFDPELGTDVVRRTETILPHDVRAYHGVVVHSDYTARRLAEDRIGLRRDLDASSRMAVGVMGKASILLHDDGAESGKPTFEGSFDWAGNEHTIQLPLHYDTGRSQHDPPVTRRALKGGSPVLHRRSDRMSATEAGALGIRADDDSVGCSADGYEYNAQNALRLPASQDVDQDLASTLSPFSFFAVPTAHKLGRRNLFPSLHGMTDMFGRSPSLDSDRHSYSYHREFVKRQSDVLGGSNNDSYLDEIGSTSGCPTANRVVYMGVATDCTYTGRFSNSSAARVQVLNDVCSREGTDVRGYVAYIVYSHLPDEHRFKHLSQHL